MGTTRGRGGGGGGGGGGCASQPSTIFIPPRGRGEGRFPLAPPQGCRGGHRSSKDVVVVVRVASQEASLGRGIKDLLSA